MCMVAGNKVYVHISNHWTAVMVTVMVQELCLQVEVFTEVAWGRAALKSSSALQPLTRRWWMINTTCEICSLSLLSAPLLLQAVVAAPGCQLCHFPSVSSMLDQSSDSCEEVQRSALGCSCAPSHRELVLRQRGRGTESWDSLVEELWYKWTTNILDQVLLWARCWVRNMHGLNVLFPGWDRLRVSNAYSWCSFLITLQKLLLTGVFSLSATVRVESSFSLHSISEMLHQWLVTLFGLRLMSCPVQRISWGNKSNTVFKSLPCETPNPHQSEQTPGKESILY